MLYSTGLIPSPEDKRDYLLTSFLPPLTVELPNEYYDWLGWQTPVKYQDGLGACVSFTGTGQIESYNWKEYGTVPDLSEQFVYGEAKKIDGLPNAEGTHFRAVYTVLKDLGACEEQYVPYEAKYPPSTAPKEGYLENAKKYKISTYASVGITKEAIKTAIFQNGPVGLAIKVYSNFANIDSTGIAKAPSGAYIGGHGIEGCAYNTLGIICKNSWSAYWGGIVINGIKYPGYCLIPWTVWEDINLGEVWSVVDMVERKKPWTDWPESELELGFLTKNSRILQGYPDGTFRPWNNVTQHQAIVIAERLGFPLPKLSREEEKASWVTPALRGWIHQLWPQYVFLEERWEESITRYQFALIIGRYLKLKAQNDFMV